MMMMIKTMKSILTGHPPSKHMVCRVPGRFVYPSSHPPYFLRDWKIYPTSKYYHHHHHHHIFFVFGKYIQLLNIIITIFSLDLESTSCSQPSSSTADRCPNSFRHSSINIPLFLKLGQLKLYHHLNALRQTGCIDKMRRV